MPRPEDVRARCRARLLSVMLVALVAGCASENTRTTNDATTKRDDTTSNPSGTANESFVTPVDPVPAADPILSISTAADIDTNGAPVGPTHVFAPNAPMITVVVRVGDVEPRSSLQVAWSWDDGTTKAALFTHTISITSGDVAYSQGLSTGSLTRGRFDVDVTLGSARSSASFMVLAMPTASGIADLVSDTVPVTEVLPVAPAPPPGPEPPASGHSGVDHPQTQQAPAGTGCQLTLTGDGSLYATLDTTGCAGDVTVGAAGAADGALTIIDPNLQGDTLRFWSTDPCKVGGSDLPESQLRYAAQVVRGPDKGLRREITGAVPKDTSPPAISFTSTPAPYDLALPGSRVVLNAEAVDGNASGVGASGIAAIKILDPNGKILEESHFDGPTSCDASRLSKQIAATYTVPQNSPSSFKLTVIATDFAGNTQRLGARYVTTAAWDGVIVVKTVATLPGATCRQTWQVIFSITVTEGSVSGTGDATPVTAGSCPLGEGATYATDEIFSITGTFDGHLFHIQFELAGGYGYDTGLHVLWFPQPVTIDIPWGVGTTGSGTADLKIFNDVGELGDNSATAELDGYIQLLLKRPAD